MKTHWEFMVENEAGLRRLCAQMCGPEFEDEAFSYLSTRIEGIVRTWDPLHESGASLKTHVYKNCKWYLWKWRVRKDTPKQELKWEELDETQSYEVDLSVNVEVKQILERLSEYDRTLLMLYHVRGETFGEIGERLGVVKATARNHYLTALRRAQELIDEDEGDRCQLEDERQWSRADNDGVGQCAHRHK